MEEDYNEARVNVRLTRDDIVRISNGEILEGFQTRVGLVGED